MALITGVDVTAITVGDMERALRFYRDLLGMTIMEMKGAGSGWSSQEQSRWDTYHEKVCGILGARIQVVFLQAPDGSRLELVEYQEPKRPPGPRRAISEPGVAVVPFGVKDSPEVVRELRAAGVEVIADPVRYLLDGVTSYTTYLYDPDGNALCLFEIVDDGE